MNSDNISIKKFIELYKYNWKFGKDSKEDVLCVFPQILFYLILFV